MMKKINETEYEEEKIETRIYGEQKPTILLFTDGTDHLDEMYKKYICSFSQIDQLEIRSYEIDINECPNIAAEYHVGGSDSIDPKLSSAPVVIITLNTADGKNCKSRRFTFTEGLGPIHDFIYDFKKLYGIVTMSNKVTSNEIIG